MSTQYYATMRLTSFVPHYQNFGAIDAARKGSGARTSPGRPPGGATRTVAWSSSTCCRLVPVWGHFGYRRSCTVLQVEECQMTQVKMADRHGFNALQLGVGLRKAKNVTKPVLGHRAKRQL
ncbi:hypothetical protein PF002_g22551 [Phytophthora fragariae]|uniref:Uncharacterized protein n=1 Tax=Phytophthora fragariae TaxID=53985 RepID=A0A6A3X849_9STRA|nr:hypothetical protein PF002_g22551 [Phytophthora fragariae]